MFADGLYFSLILLGNQYLYKEEYKVQPATLQLYHSLLMVPYLLRFFMGVTVDAKLINRKYYVVVMNLIPGILNLCLAFKMVDTPGSVCAVQFISNIFH